MTLAADDPVLHGCVVLGRQRSRLVLGCQSAAIGTGPERLALEVSVQHRAAGQNDAGQIRAQGTHDGRGNGLVAIDQQDHAVKGLAADHLLRIHGGQVAQEHGCRIQEDFTQRDGWKLKRQSASLKHAAPDRLDQFRKVAVAVVEFAPGVANADDGAVHVQVVVPHRLDEGTVQEAGHPGFLKEGFASEHGIHPVGWPCRQTSVRPDTDGLPRGVIRLPIRTVGAGGTGSTVAGPGPPVSRQAAPATGPGTTAVRRSAE